MGAKIISVASYVPDTIVTNDDLKKYIDTSDEWISTRTGIKTRRISDGEYNFEMATKSALLAIERANISAKDIDAIITTTGTPDFFFPSMGCLIQDKIGAVNAFAYDISAACSGFVYALDVAKSYIDLNKAKNVLVVSSENLSKITDFTDRSSCILFGDGSGAVIVSKDDSKNDNMEIIDNLLISDGSGAMDLYCNAVRKKQTFEDKEITNSASQKIEMDGTAVFKFAVKVIPKIAEQILKRNNLTIGQVKLIIPHQANIRIIQSAAKKLEISMDKMYVNIQDYGNTSSASIPLCLDEIVKQGNVKKGEYVLFLAFGAGYTAGASLIKW